MTIMAEFARLAAIECLAPTANIHSGTGFPTMAGASVYDSRRIASGELSANPFTPSLSLYTRSASSARRGPGQGSVERFSRTVLEIVAELSISAADESGVFTDALADDDPAARLVLAALCGQVRSLLTARPGGSLFRKMVMSIDGIDYEPFAVPQLGLRWQRTTMLFECAIPDDDYSAGGFPQPALALSALFPAQSYAAGEIARLTDGFPADPAFPALETIAFAVKQTGVSGQAGPANSIAPPFTEPE